MIRCHELTKTFTAAGGDVEALDRLTVEVRPGEFVCVEGPSGCGKTTLLLTLGGMLKPTRGNVFVGDTDLYSLSDTDRAEFRARTIGFVFQMFHLLPYLDVLENVELAAHPRGGRREASALLERLGLGARARHKPAELSAGEKQRTAIARALLQQPKVVLADEPTGNLDPESTTEVFRLLTEFHQSGGTVLVVSHGGIARPYAQRVLRLEAGTLREDL